MTNGRTCGRNGQTAGHSCYEKQLQCLKKIRIERGNYRKSIMRVSEPDLVVYGLGVGSSLNSKIRIQNHFKNQVDSNFCFSSIELCAGLPFFIVKCRFRCGLSQTRPGSAGPNSKIWIQNQFNSRSQLYIQCLFLDKV